MKITRIEATTHRVPVSVPLLPRPLVREFVFVRAETEAGVVGYGLTGPIQALRGARAGEVANGWRVEFHLLMWAPGETIVRPPPGPVRGTVTLSEQPGLGLEPVEDLLRESRED